MGLLRYIQRKKRAARVGICDDETQKKKGKNDRDNDLGSFSGLVLVFRNKETETGRDNGNDNRSTNEISKDPKKKSSFREETDDEAKSKKRKQKHKWFFFRSVKDKEKQGERNRIRNKNKSEKHRLPPHDTHDYDDTYEDSERNINTGDYELETHGSSDLSVYTSNSTRDNNEKYRYINISSESFLSTSNLHQQQNDSDLRADGLDDASFVTLEHVPDLILDLETAVIVGARRSIRALKMLLALSSLSKQSSPSNRESATGRIYSTRVAMVHTLNGKLIPTLLRFLKRCTVQTKEHTLTLLLLVNLSIPRENKPVIALDFRGIEILSRLLCEEPSCHLVALVLVCLTDESCPFSEDRSNDDYAIEVTAVETNNGINVVPPKSFSLRKELLATNGNTALIESLAFCLRVSSLTPDEYEGRRDTIEDCNYGEDYLSPSTRLSIVMAKDQQLRALETEFGNPSRVLPATVGPDQILQQLRSNERELQRFGSIDGTIVDHGVHAAAGGNHIGSHGSPTHFTLHSSLRRYPPPMVDASKQMHPETAKWCLVALRNLTKPTTSDATAAHVLIKSAVFTVVLQCITTDAGTATIPWTREQEPVQATIPAAPVRVLPTETINPPHSWVCDSIQDVALSIVLNLSASSNSREYMNEPHTVRILSRIAEYPRQLAAKEKRRMRKRNNKTTRVAIPENSATLTPNEHETSNFQALKARMALSYLIGSQGHFGQAKLRSSASTVWANRADSSLVMSDCDADLFVELLANILDHRGKNGNGGGNYLPGTFSPRCVIFALRCMLTHTHNQETLAKRHGLELHTLLINALLRHAFEPSVSPLDAESAGHVAFALYLLSNHCFEGGSRFLPKLYESRQHAARPRDAKRDPSSTPPIEDNDPDDPGLAATILESYLRLPGVPPEGRHAAQQLLLRLDYMNFGNHADPFIDAKTSGERPIRTVVQSADLKIDYILLAKIKRAKRTHRERGPKPDPSIFHRPVLRCQKPCNWDPAGSSNNDNKPRKTIEWNHPSTVSAFANALSAVQQLSYGSTKVSHSGSGPIDDVAIANAIARSCDGIHTEAATACHNFLWAWEVDAAAGMSSPATGGRRAATLG